MIDQLAIQPIDTVSSSFDESLPQAAVMILIKPCDKKGMAGPQLVMAQKTAHLRKHAGEVVFPGGMLEQGETHLQAALRECDEEIGLKAENIQLLGALSPQLTRFNVVVYPYVALLEQQVSYQMDTFELQSVFELPLEFLSQPENALQEPMEFEGEQLMVHCYRYQQYKIWGVTALMIKELVGGLQ